MPTNSQRVGLKLPDDWVREIDRLASNANMPRNRYIAEQVIRPAIDPQRLLSPPLKPGRPAKPEETPNDHATGH